MNWLRVWALIKKEFIQIVRDPHSLAMAIAIPLMLLLLFGFALTLDVDRVPLAVWNQDKSQISSDFILNFKNSRYFKIIGYYDNYAQLQNLIDRNQALMAMVIHRDFSKLLRANMPAPVQLLVDGSDSNTATIAMGYVDAIIAGFNKKFQAAVFSKSGVQNPAVIDMRASVWFNEDLKSRNFIVPGLIVVIMTVIAAMLTSLTIAREWERGTMEQLISTPVRKSELILGKFIPYFLIGFLDLLMSVWMAEFIYHVPFRGSLTLLFALSAVFLTGALMLGMFVSIVAGNQLTAIQMSILATFLPAFLLSGFAYAIYNMPEAIQVITRVVPARYFIVILRSIYLKGVGPKVLWPEVALLVLFAVIMVTLAMLKFRKKIV